MREEEEGVDYEGADVEVGEGGGVGFGAVFAGFLGHFDGVAVVFWRRVVSLFVV